MTPERATRLRQVAEKRQGNLTVILENVHDPHNQSAVLRSCEAVGIHEIYVLYTDPGISTERLQLGARSSAGARRWVDTHLFHDTDACFAHIRRYYQYIYSTHLGPQTKSLYQLDLSASVALLFGNEHSGLTAEALAHADANFSIPQAGMVRSLNISVACAVTLYEAYRQREQKGFYDTHLPATPEQRDALFQEYKRRHETKDKNKKPHQH